MFDGLSDRLQGVFERLTRRGTLSESEIDEALREVRVALLEADVALPVVKDLTARVREEAKGQDVIKAVTPGQMVVKIVHDTLVDVLGGEAEEALHLNATPPVVVLMLGLQGSGKTTTTGKLARRLTQQDGKKVLMASLDVYRPAAWEQLAALGTQTGVDTLPIVQSDKPLAIAERALKEAKRGGYDVLLLDTAGRLTIDDALMDELVRVRDRVKPHESLLVADALTGQDAVTTAQAFHEQVGISGIVLTRVDGDSRGGAALSMRAVTGRPIRFLGMGEAMDALEPFKAERLAGRILGMGDVVSLVEKAAEVVDQQAAEDLAKRMMAGQFDLEDMLKQFQQIRKIGDMKGIMGMLPGMGAMKKQMAAAAEGMDERSMKRQEAVILSMTPKERRNPAIIKAKRRQRIAVGSGTSVADVNKVLKAHGQMASMMSRMKKQGGLAAALSRGLGGMMGGSGGGLPGGMPGDLDPAMLKDLPPDALQGLLGGPGAPGGGFGGALPGGKRKKLKIRR